ncbi:MAG: metallophosphoesterase [Gammaproteobacteria bacterium]
MIRPCPPLDDAMRTRLEARLGRLHLNQRLGIETDYEARVFGQGRNFFHIENWYSIHGWMRGALRLMGVHGRGQRNARAIECRENRIVLPHLPPAFDGLRILHISDLHLDMAPDLPQVLLEAVRGVDYDLCVLTGDFRAETFGPYAAALDGLRRVRVGLGGAVYGVLGNHDTVCMLPGLEDMDIRMLMNETVRIERDGSCLYLSGIDDPHYYRMDNLEKTICDVPASAVSILLAHSPEIFRHAAYADFDVLLCGHTHGGQICLPGGRPILCNARCPRGLCRGAWRYRQLHGYTSTGSGVCMVDVRLNCPPEITVHRLVRGTDPDASA